MAVMAGSRTMVSNVETISWGSEDGDDGGWSGLIESRDVGVG